MATNGGGLEDCHTNTFALTELNNLRWRCYFNNGGPPPSMKLHDDPILKAYAACIQAQILCNWRRQPPPLPSNPEPMALPIFNPNATKELWVFWFAQDEPNDIAKYTVGLQNTDAENGPGNASVCGISYEVRCMFFKALCNILSFRLQRAGIMRFGRWFTKPLKQPLNGREHLISRYSLAYTFKLFIAGGNTVCANFVLQRQPPLFRLTRKHLDLRCPIPVIIGPWSLRGILIGTDSSMLRSQPPMEQQWEEWKYFWNLSLDEETEDSKEEGVPLMVVVEVDGFKMLHPSSLVCIALADDPLRDSQKREAEDDNTLAQSNAMTDLKPHVIDETIAADGGRRNVMHNDNMQALRFVQSAVEDAFFGRKKGDVATYGANEDEKCFLNDPTRADVCNCEQCTTEGLGVVSDRVADVKVERRIKPKAQYNSDGSLKTKSKEEKEAELRLLAKIRKKNWGLPNYHRLQYLQMSKRKSTHGPHGRRNDSDEDYTEEETSDKEEGNWGSTTRDYIKTGIYCSTDETTYHWKDNMKSPGNSSDDDTFVCSPFTPVKTLSPYQADKLVLDGRWIKTPEDKRAKKKKTDWSTFSLPEPPLSPDQPGSQETIPATSSPISDAEFIKSRLDNADLKMIRPKSRIGLNTTDVETRGRIRAPLRQKRITRKIIEFPNLKRLNVVHLAEENGEDVKFKVPNDSVRSRSSCSNTESESEEETSREHRSTETQTNQIKPLAAGQGEGPSSQSALWPTEINSASVTGYPVDEAMDLDEVMAAASIPHSVTADVLSPPASNERVEHSSFLGGTTWHRGPPSVDPQMNQIYPTPPSVQTDLQQFSPIANGTLLTGHSTQHPHQHDTSGEVPMIEENARIQEPSSNEFIPLVKEHSAMAKLLRVVDDNPVFDYRRKYDVPEASRFATTNHVVMVTKLKRNKIPMPPDYTKVAALVEKNAPKRCSSFEDLASFNIQSRQMQQHSHQPPNPLNQIQQNLPFAQQRMGPPRPPHMGYSHQPVQQLNNFVNNSMYTTGPPMHMSHPHQGQMGHHPQQSMQYGQPQHPQQNLFYRNPNPNSFGSNPMGMDPMMGGSPMQPSMHHPGYNGAPHQAHQGHQGMGMSMQGHPQVAHGGYPQHSSQPMHMQHQQQQMPTMQPPPPAYPMGPPQMGLSTGLIGQQEQMMLEGVSLPLSLLLQDTILDLHYDTVFDACPICSCNTAIKARELGLYLTPPDILRQQPYAQAAQISTWSGFHVESPNVCACGFSAVRYRYLSMCSGLFPEDAREATGLEYSVAHIGGVEDIRNVQTSSVWFDSSSRVDMNLLDVIRIMAQHRDMASMVTQGSIFSEHLEKAIKSQDVGFDVSSRNEYIISHIDSVELLLIWNGAIDHFSVGAQRPPTRDPKKNVLQYFHPWGLQVANELREPLEAEWRAVLIELRPVLEDAMRAARGFTGPGQIVEGPLTWRHFSGKCVKIGSGLEEDSVTAEPIPHIMVSNEKDSLRAAPYIIRSWESLNLGPVDQPKDVLYLTVIPDSAELHDKTSRYMEDFSQCYERMRFGRHIPLIRGDNLKDGIIRLGMRGPLVPSQRINDCFLDNVEKYRLVENRPMLLRLKTYCEQFEEMVLQYLFNDDVFDRKTYREALALDARAKKLAAAQAVEAQNQQSIKHEQVAQFPSGPGSGGSGPGSSQPEQQGGIDAPIQELLGLADTQAQTPTSTSASSSQPQLPPLEPEEIPDDEHATLPQTIVIYLVNPFAWGTETRSGQCARVVSLALIRAFNSICQRLNVRRRPQLQLEIIGMAQIFHMYNMSPDSGKDYNIVRGMDRGTGWCERYMYERMTPNDSLRQLAITVYSTSRIMLPDCVKGILPKSMTKFGPASQLGEMVEELERLQPPIFKVPSNAWHLAPPTLMQQKADGRVVTLNGEEQTLYVSYCLLGADWLCATVTDSLGRLNDSVLINLKTRMGGNSMYRYRSKTQILDAMSRLWTYILGTISMETKSWRLVIGRVGRIGHGEFRAWASLLSKYNLRRHTQRIKESCGACARMPASSPLGGTPAILSACLVSLEPEPNLRVIPSYFTHPDNMPKHARFRSLSTPEDTSCTHIIVFPTSADIQLNSGDQQGDAHMDDDDFDIGDIDFTTGDEGGDMNEIMKGLWEDEGGAQNAPNTAGLKPGNANSFFDTPQEVSIENQPLATGFYVSTAPAGELPDWFWASCPSAKRRCPVHLKSSLHINVPLVQQGDEFLNQKTDKEKEGVENVHPLDSTCTDEVLRHVLETYNALSWLNMDPVNGERRSCLPIHMQALLRLYHSVAKLIV